MAEPEEKPSFLRQMTARTSSTGTMLMGQLKATTNMLNPMGSSATDGKKDAPEEIKNTNREYHSDEEIEKDEDMRNVSLSSHDELDDDDDQKHKGSSFLETLKRPFSISSHQGAQGSSHTNAEESPGILGQIKATTMSAGSAVITTTESAGAAIVGGLKATTQLLNPMNLGKPKEDPAEQRRVDEEFANIHIEEEAPAPAATSVEKPKVGFFEQLKMKTGLAPASPAEEEEPVQKYDPHSHTFPTPIVSHKPRFTHHQAQHDEHDAHHADKPKDPPKESFLDQIKARTGFGKDDDIAHDSAPKEGFLSSINPFASSAEPSPARKPVIPPPRRASSTTSSASSSSGGGITGMFDSLTGKSEKKPEPPKQATFMDHLTGKSTQPKKEPSFFDSITGNTSTTSSKSEGTFW